MGSGALGPQRVQGGALLLFSMGSRERSGREPMPVLPNTPPMDEVHGIEFFFGVSRILRFRGVQTCILGSYNKRFKPSLLPAFREQQGWREKESYGGEAPIAFPCPGQLPFMSVIYLAASVIFYL